MHCRHRSYPAETSWGGLTQRPTISKAVPSDYRLRRVSDLRRNICIVMAELPVSGSISGLFGVQVDSRACSLKIRAPGEKETDSHREAARWSYTPLVCRSSSLGEIA